MGLTRITAQQISDSDFKQSVRVVTTTNINLTGGAPGTVDGVTLAANNRILVAGQTTASQNGLYYVTTLGTGANGTWTRSLDGDATGEISSGMIVVATEGTAYTDSEWLLTTNDPILIGTTSLNFINLAGTIYSGTSNVIVTNSGNVSISTAGTANVVKVATTGVYVTGIVSATGNVNGANLYITTDAVVAGNLTVNGTTTTINSNSITTNDKNITVANNQTTSANVDGAGFDAGGGTPIATWRYSNATTSWQSNISITPTANGSLALGGPNNVWGTAYLTTVSATGNITSGNLNTSGILSVTGNANIVSSINVTGNVVGTGAVNAFGDLVNNPTFSGLATRSLNLVGNSAVMRVARTTVTGNPAVELLGLDPTTGAINDWWDFFTASDTFLLRRRTGGAANSLITASVDGVSFPTGVVSATGNITTSGQISATGNITTSGQISATGNITTSGQISATGNITTSGQISATGNITGGNLVTGVISGTGNVTGGNITTSGQISATGTITSNGATNSTAFAVGNSAVSNVALGMFPTAGTSGEYAIRDYSNVFSHIYFDVGMGGTANGAFQFRTSNSFRQLANINSIGVTTPLAVSAAGNVTGSYFIGNGSQLTGIASGSSSSISNGTSNVVVGASGNVTVSVAGTANAAIFTTTGIVANSIAATNNGGAYNFKVGDDAWLGDINTSDTIGIRGQQNNANGYIVFGNADATTKLGRSGSGPLTYDAAFSAVGNVTGGNLITTGLVSATNLFGTIQTASQLNITALGTLGSLTVTGNATSGNLLTGGLISATGNITGGNVLGGANVNATTHTGTTVSVTANITGGNLLTSGLISATSTITSAANITGGNLITSGASGNITGANVISATTLIATGNITGGNVLGGANVNATLFTGTTISVTGAITGASLSVSTGNINGGNIVNTNANGVGNIGSATTYFNTVFAKATSAQYADLAEMYVADAEYPPGTVVDFGGVEEITQTVTSGSTAIAGVISTNPSYIMNAGQQGTHVLPVAFTGRVPCRVQGPVVKGDVLVSSDIPGTAKRIGAQWSPGCVIGKSLGIIADSSVQTIEVVVGRF